MDTEKGTDSPKHSPLRKNLIVGSIVFLILILVVVAIVLIFTLNKSTPQEAPLCSHPNQSLLGEICSSSQMGQYQQYAISTDSNVCANTGKKILEEGGNAADAAISVLLCMGVTIPESLGLGGGSFIVYYEAKTGKSTFINARESAPWGAHRDMFNATGVPSNRSSYGVEAIGVPGELAGYWRLYSKFGSGNISWQRLFRDSIDFARNGFPVGEHLDNALEQKRETIMSLSQLRGVYINPKTKDIYKKDEIMRQPALAITLEKLSLASNPHEYFYTNLAQLILEDIYQNVTHEFPDQTPIINLFDFRKYQVIESEAYTYTLRDNLTLHTVKLPGSGQLLSFILRVMLKYNDLYPNARFDKEKAILFFHRLIETYKYAFASRMYLGDDRFDDVTGVLANLTSESFIEEIFEKIDDNQTYPSSSGHYDGKHYNKMDSGTAHLSVLDKHGNAIAVTSTVNLYFGSKVFSPSTGILLNDEMDDFNTGAKNEFDLPVSYANAVYADKRPLSSMSPSIFTDDSGVRLVIGASGGPKILTSIAYTSLRQLWLQDSIKTAIDSSRVHDQLFPENVVYEAGFPSDILNGLRQHQHNVTQLPKDVRGAVVMGISRDRDGAIRANSDYRKGGTVAGL